MSAFDNILFFYLGSNTPERFVELLDVISARSRKFEFSMTLTNGAKIDNSVYGDKKALLEALVQCEENALRVAEFWVRFEINSTTYLLHRPCRWNSTDEDSIIIEQVPGLIYYGPVEKGDGKKAYEEAKRNFKRFRFLVELISPDYGTVGTFHDLYPPEGMFNQSDQIVNLFIHDKLLNDRQYWVGLSEKTEWACIEFENGVYLSDGFFCDKQTKNTNQVSSGTGIDDSLKHELFRLCRKYYNVYTD
jgi:hypothetical protein